MKYGVVVRTRLDGFRVYGPYDSERAIGEFQRWKQRALDCTYASYQEDATKHADDPQDVELATFAESPDDLQRAAAEALVRERSS